MSLENLYMAVQGRTPQSGAQEKTPAELLNDYCSKICAAPPAYSWSKPPGDPFSPVVTCMVTVGDVTGTGEGTRKQSAKQNAAAAAWALIPKEITISTPKESPAAPNPVGQLQELAMKQGLALPRYWVVGEQGAPHDMQFTMACEYGGFEGAATGTSKKIGKHGAAANVLAQVQQATQQLEEEGLQEDGPFGYPEEDTAPTSMTPGSPSINGV